MKVLVAVVALLLIVSGADAQTEPLNGVGSAAGSSLVSAGTCLSSSGTTPVTISLNTACTSAVTWSLTGGTYTSAALVSPTLSGTIVMSANLPMGAQSITFNADAALLTGGANIIKQVNGTSAQTLEVWGSTTSSKRLGLGEFDGAAHYIDAIAGQLFLNAPASSQTCLGFGKSAKWCLNGASPFQFSPNGPGTGDLGDGSNGIRKLFMDYTNTATVGAVTINKAAGRVNMGAGAGTFLVTNSLVTANSHIFLNADSAPGNVVAVQFYAVAGAGSFTVNAVPVVTNQTAIDFFVVNAD